MSKLTEIKILRAEVDSWDESNLGCFIFSNNELLEIVTPISEEHKIQMPENSLLRVLLKSMDGSDVFIGSVSIAISELLEGTAWLPLFTEIDSDLISDRPEAVHSPRVMISTKSCSTLPSENANWESERLKLQIETQQVVDQSKNFQIQSLTESLESSDIKARNLEDQLNACKRELSSSACTHVKQEESLIALLVSRDSMVESLENELSVLRKAYTDVFQDNLNLRAKGKDTENNQIQTDTEVNLLKKQVEFYKDENKNLLNALEHLGNDLKKHEDSELVSSNSLKNENFKLREELGFLSQKNTNLERMILEKENLVSSVEDSYKTEVQTLSKQLFYLKDSYKKTAEELRLKEENTDPSHTARITERLIAEALEELGMTEDFQHSQENYYIFREAIIELEIIKDELYVHTNRSYVHLEEFVNKLNESFMVQSSQIIQSKSPKRGRENSKRFLGSNLNSKKKLKSTDTARDKNKRPFK